MNIHRFSVTLLVMGLATIGRTGSDMAPGTGPSIVALDPADGSYTFGSRENVLVATFDQPIILKSGGKLGFRDLTDNSSSTLITLPDPRVTSPNGNDLHIDMGDRFELGTHYAILIGKDAVSAKGAASSVFPGIRDLTTWNFSTVRKLHNVLLVTIEIKDDKPNRTVEQGLGQLFHNKENVDEAFRVASYGDFGLVLGDGSDMEPTVELKWPHLGPDDHRKKNFRNRAHEEIVKMGYDLDNYRFIYYVLPRSVSGPDGSASIGGTWSNYKVFWIGTIVHEMGHCLGAQHSVRDPGCVMGPNYDNFNAAKKDYLGWLKPFPGTVTNVTSETSLRLVPLNAHPQRMPGMRVINVPLPKGESLCISYRVDKSPYSRIKGNASNSKRVHVSYLPPNGRSRSHHKASLAAGKTLDYKGVGITCEDVSEDGMSATVTIRFPDEA